MDGSESGSGSRPVVRGVERARPSQSLRKWSVLALVAALGFSGSAQTVHKVVKGDTLSRIAKKYGTTTRAIAQANHLTNPNLIIIGRDLTIPAGGPPPPAIPTTAGSQLEWSGQHVVTSGDNLTRIAQKYGTTVKELVSANAIRNPSHIRVGITLKVPRPIPLSVEQLMEKYSKEFGMNLALIKAIAWQESGWKQHTMSSAGAIGVMQVLPETGAFISRHLLRRPIDLNDVEQNVAAGVKFFAYLLSHAGGNEELAVAGYFQGLRSVRTAGATPKTQRYVANVIALKKRFGG